MTWTFRLEETLKNQNYNRHGNYDLNNIEDDSVPLLINCAGIAARDYPFETHVAEGRNDYFFFYLYKGELEIMDERESRLMRAGHLMFYAPHTPYRYRKSDDSEMNYLWVHFTGFEAAKLMELCGFVSGKIYRVGSHDTIVQQFKDLFREFILGDVFSDFGCAAEAQKIFLSLARLALSGSSFQEGTSLFQASKEYMHRNFASNVTAEKLASMENLSQSRYRAAFRMATGLSPSEYLMGLRIRNACTLLEQTDLSIQEVAAASGYGDPFYFSRMFKKNIGFSPSVYRENMWGKSLPE